MKTYKLHVIRHGLAEANLKGVYMGRKTDSPLCARGVLDLQDLAAKFDYPAIDKLYTSPLMRCEQTAHLLYPRVKNKMVVDDVAEMDFGIFEGKSLDSLANNADFAAFLKGDPDYKIPEGESMREFSMRCMDGFDQIITDMMANQIDSAALVTHGGVILQVLGNFGYPKLAPKDLMVDSGYGFTLNIIPRLWQTDQIIEIVGVAPHGATMEDSRSMRR